jgi:cold-inducible RNA-binding protein
MISIITSTKDFYLMESKLYVGNLPYTTTDEDLRTAFGAYGEVVEVTIITERDTGRSKGFGFVEMSTEEAATAALNGLNGADFGGRTLRVDKARPRTERRRRPPQRDYDDW